MFPRTLLCQEVIFQVILERGYSPVEKISWAIPGKEENTAQALFCMDRWCNTSYLNVRGCWVLLDSLLCQWKVFGCRGRIMKPQLKAPVLLNKPRDKTSCSPAHLLEVLFWSLRAVRCESWEAVNKSWLLWHKKEGEFAESIVMVWGSVFRNQFGSSGPNLKSIGT